MFKTTLVGRTGGYVSYKKVTNSQGNEMDQLVYTVFVNTGNIGSDGKNLATPVRCVQRGKDLSKRAEMLMVQTEGFSSENPKYVSRCIAIDGRVNIETRVESTEVYDKVDGKMVIAVDANGEPYRELVKNTSVCVFVDSFEVLDANPDKSGKKPATSESVNSRRGAEVKDNKEAKDNKKVKDSAKENVVEGEEVVGFNSKSVAEYLG